MARSFEELSGLFFWCLTRLNPCAITRNMTRANVILAAWMSGCFLTFGVSGAVVLCPPWLCALNIVGGIGILVYLLVNRGEWQ